MDPRIFAWEFQHHAGEEEKGDLAVGPVALARSNCCFGGNPVRALVPSLQSAAMVPSSTSTSTSTATAVSTSTSTATAVSTSTSTAALTSTSTPVLRRSARKRQRATQEDEQMPELISPPETSPRRSFRMAPRAQQVVRWDVEQLATQNQRPRWPSWYRPMSRHFVWNVPGSDEEWPGTNRVERSILRAALQIAQPGVCMTQQRQLVLRIIRDAWLAANICRDAGLEPE